MDKNIFPSETAAFFTKCAGQTYRPSNGTEGEIFYETWCASCVNDDLLTETYCSVWGKALSCDCDDKEYPKELVYGFDGQPKCLAYQADEATMCQMDYMLPFQGDLFRGAP